jgi:hypothetical protein
MKTLLDSLSGELATQLRGEGRDFYRIRPYEAPDSARHVDWKSTAHTGALQVREFARDQHRIVEIFFDRRILPGQTKQFERLIESCAFLVWRLAEKDARVWVRSQRFALALPEDGDVYEVLKFLALVEPILQSSPADDLGEPADRSNLQVVFSASSQSEVDAEESGWSARVVS